MRLSLLQWTTGAAGLAAGSRSQRRHVYSPAAPAASCRVASHNAPPCPQAVMSSESRTAAAASMAGTAAAARHGGRRRHPRGATRRALVAALVAAFAACSAVAAAAGAGELQGAALRRYLRELHANSTVLNSELLLDASLEATAAGRSLLADGDWSKYQREGRYVIIKNPQMSGERVLAWTAERECANPRQQAAAEQQEPAAQQQALVALLPAAHCPACCCGAQAGAAAPARWPSTQCCCLRVTRC